MAPEYVSVTGDDLPFLRGAYAYRSIVNEWERRGKPPLIPKETESFCSWLGSQTDMQRVIDLAVERYTLDIGTLQFLLGISDDTSSPLAGGVL